MNKYLVGIPVLHGVDHTREAIESAIHEQSHVYVIDNNAAQGVKNMMMNFDDKIEIHVNKENVFVNPAWNQILKRFLDDRQFTHVVLFNSDAILPPNWPRELDKFYKKFPLSHIPVPYETHDKRFAWQEQDIEQEVSYALTDGGIRGICIILTREQVNLIYPIPDGIKVWFGDNWIYDGLRKMEYYVLRHYNITVYHALSQNVSIVPEAITQIEEDKVWWESFGKENMEKSAKKNSLKS